jgi:hypothetical protein
VTEKFVSMPRVSEVIGSGETKTSVLTSAGLQVDLRIVEPRQFGAASQYFTGSKAHNIKLRQLALDKGCFSGVRQALPDEGNGLGDQNDLQGTRSRSSRPRCEAVEGRLAEEAPGRPRPREPPRRSPCPHRSLGRRPESYRGNGRGGGGAGILVSRDYRPRREPRVQRREPGKAPRAAGPDQSALETLPVDDPPPGLGAQHRSGRKPRLRRGVSPQPRLVRRGNSLALRPSASRQTRRVKAMEDGRSAPSRTSPAA